MRLMLTEAVRNTQPGADGPKHLPKIKDVAADGR